MNNEDTPTLLIVDDDRDIRELIAQLLAKEGYKTLLAKDGAEMIKHLAQKPSIGLIVLDVMMPGEDGLSLLKRLPTLIHPVPPVLMLSARGEDVDRIVGLEMGADDYLVKPFHPRELLARIKSVLRRRLPPEGTSDLDVVVFADWMFDRTRRLLYKVNPQTNKEALRALLREDGEGLNTIEYRLLKAFTDHPQRVLSRDFLLDATLGREHIPTDRTIDVQMSRLRQRLGDDARQASLIRTVRYEGYMLSAAVEKLS